jgi:hypothetical protein
MKANKTVIMYKRHAASCAVFSDPTLTTPAQKAVAWDCPCMIWLGGRLPSGDPVQRHSTGHSEFRKAEQKRLEYIRTMVKDPRTSGPSPSIAACVRTFQSARAHEIEESTALQNRFVLERFTAYCEGTGASTWTT